MRRRVTLLVATYLAVPAALAGADLIATLPSRAARQIAATAEIAILPLPIDLSVTVAMAVAPPRRERTGAGMVSRAAGAGGGGIGVGQARYRVFSRHETPEESTNDPRRP